MDFGYFSGYGHGNFTDFAFGGGMDVKLTRRLSLRPVDFEYQYMPLVGQFQHFALRRQPVGMSYKIF